MISMVHGISSSQATARVDGTKGAQAAASSPAPELAPTDQVDISAAAQKALEEAAEAPATASAEARSGEARIQRTQSQQTAQVAELKEALATDDANRAASTAAAPVHVVA